ncbi:MAG: hypothetical protein ACM3WP_05190 [Acidobacteriota bacterium]
MTRLVWVLIFGLVLFPVIYFAVNWSNETFREGAIGNWFGTVIGVIVGVPVGVTLAKAQQKSQAEADKRRDAFIRAERLRSMKRRVFDELQHDSGVVKQLAEVLSKSQMARSDLWSWAVQTANAIEFEAYREFDAMMLPEERGCFDALAVGYLDLRRLVSRIRESLPAHEFLMGYSASEEAANWRLQETKAHIDVVLSELATAIKGINS